jgi:hypothetical protein
MGPSGRFAATSPPSGEETLDTEWGGDFSF